MIYLISFLTHINTYKKITIINLNKIKNLFNAFILIKIRNNSKVVKI